MGQSEQIEIYLEIGKKYTFAGALGWPGWCRGERNEEAALAALLAYAPRYAQVLEPAGIAFAPPDALAAFTIVERLPGDSTTDFGAPGAIPAGDTEAAGEAGIRQYQALLSACWGAFDRALAAAAGQELRKGPRGGGRDREKIIAHVVEADQNYLAKVGQKLKFEAGQSLDMQISLIRQTFNEVLAAAARGELPTQGPRGGAYWPVRYLVRRTAWHVLDHVWEIEDRLDR